MLERLRRLRLQRTGLGLATLKAYEGDRRPLLENALAITRVLRVRCEVFEGCEFRYAGLKKPQKKGRESSRPAGRPGRPKAG